MFTAENGKSLVIFGAWQASGPAEQIQDAARAITAVHTEQLREQQRRRTMMNTGIPIPVRTPR